MLLREEARNEEGRAEVEALASSLGFTATTVGSASLSFRIEPAALHQVFGVEAVPIGPVDGRSTDYGSPAGYAATELSVPSALRPFVELITVSSPALRLDATA